MRVAAALSLALAAAPAVVSAKGQFGFALGTKNPDGSCKSAADYGADFDAIAKNSQARIVRGYSASDCDFAKVILPVAKSKGFKVVLGIWYVMLAKVIQASGGPFHEYSHLRYPHHAPYILTNSYYPAFSPHCRTM